MTGPEKTPALNESKVAPGKSAWDRRWDVHHKCYVTYRYHRRRQRFFDIFDKVTKSLTVVLGASLLGHTVSSSLPLIASAISCLGLLALVFSYSDRKQSHKELAEAAMGLVAKIDELPHSEIDHAKAGLWESELARLNAKEPPALKTLVIICEREQCIADGHQDHVPNPFWLRRFLADFIS